ncbi:MAG: sigma-70 family RNA polymerase sigma factor [Oculatellaceae cyanobacterium Prado106]|jgi:RNA polymerase sigma-70 factor (ECF subfamily)|nr:sigma-70 family RNA polymerase sigma factor [Oculatellaceae cyanobacterium Prado106]
MDSEHSPADLASLKDSSDEDVLVALRQGQMSALDVLYDRYAKQVYSLAYRFLASAEESEDLTQEVFLALLQKNTYQRDRGSLKTFLLTLTRSRAIDKIRYQGSRHRFLQRWQRLSMADQATAPPLEGVSVNEQSVRLREALSDLSDSEQEILKIAYFEGMSQTEIAKRLNLPLGTVKSRSRQALSKLRQRLHPFQ